MYSSINWCILSVSIKSEFADIPMIHNFYQQSALQEGKVGELYNVINIVVHCTVHCSTLQYSTLQCIAGI